MSENKNMNGLGSEVKTSKVHTVGELLKPGVYIPRNRSLHRLHADIRTVPKRAVLKNGECNTEKIEIEGSFINFSSWFLAMVETRWRWTLLFFFTAFTSNWLLFGFIYWIISYNHGDLILEHLPHNQEKNNWTACIENINSFTSTFLFSIEVHTTVAYGRRAITLECPQAIFVMCMQCIVSSIFQCFMIGILFAKLTRPKSRTNTIIFSKHCVVCFRNDKLSLMFRVGDMRSSRILNIKLSMFLLKSNDGECLGEQIELKNEIDGCESTFFLWPVTVIHEINEFSPLFDVSALDLLSNKLEIIAVFEGIIESTGQPVQARTSFAENEVLWGHNFSPIVAFKTDKEMYEVNFSKLNKTTQVDTPLCSAAEFRFIKSITEFPENK